MTTAATTAPIARDSIIGTVIGIYEIVGFHEESSWFYAEVQVVPVRVQNNYGQVSEVTRFWANGSAWAWTTAGGFKIKKDGTRYNRVANDLSVVAPDAVKAILDSLKIKDA